MATKKKPAWQQRRPKGHGPRLMDGEVPTGRPAGGGVFEAFSWRLALIFLGLGLLVALIGEYAC